MDEAEIRRIIRQEIAELRNVSEAKIDVSESLPKDLPKDSAVRLIGKVKSYFIWAVYRAGKLWHVYATVLGYIAAFNQTTFYSPKVLNQVAIVRQNLSEWMIQKGTPAPAISSKDRQLLYADSWHALPTDLALNDAVTQLTSTTTSTTTTSTTMTPTTTRDPNQKKPPMDLWVLSEGSGIVPPEVFDTGLSWMGNSMDVANELATRRRPTTTYLMQSFSSPPPGNETAAT